MTSLSFRVRKFSTDADAVAATEFAIVVPFMLLLYVGGVELADGMAINVKVSATAHSVADMVTQNTSLSTTSMHNILTGATAIIAPYPVSGGQLLVTVSEISSDANGNLTISASNDFASSTLGSAASGGAIGGTITSALTFSTASAPVADANAQATRANLVAQYNNILQQIDTTAQDSSFNGVNLLNGDQLKLVFDETGKSSLNITGVTYNTTGLGLAALTSGVDFIDNAATNKVLTNLNAASSTLRSEGSSLGSNLSIVQVRQDFNKNLINVLQTGSSNLTLADTNEEAANSQALSTRQSIAVSALSLANQSQQSVLQLLR